MSESNNNTKVNTNTNTNADNAVYGYVKSDNSQFWGPSNSFISLPSLNSAKLKLYNEYIKSGDGVGMDVEKFNDYLTQEGHSPITSKAYDALGTQNNKPLTTVGEFNAVETAKNAGWGQEGVMGTLRSENMGKLIGGLGTALNAAAAVGGYFNAKEANKLARETLDFNKKASMKNYESTRTQVNNNIRDKNKLAGMTGSTRRSKLISSW
jgi:hypothetical protein